MKSIETTLKSTKPAIPASKSNQQALWKQLQHRSADAAVFEATPVKTPTSTVHQNMLWQQLKLKGASAKVMHKTQVEVPQSEQHHAHLWSTLKEHHAQRAVSSLSLSKGSLFQFFMNPAFAATCVILLVFVGAFSVLNHDGSGHTVPGSLSLPKGDYISYQSQYVVRNKELVYRSAQMHRLESFHTHLTQLDYYAQSVTQ